MRMFTNFQRNVHVALGGVVMMLATLHVAAMPLSHATGNDIRAEHALADPGAQAYTELLNMQEQAIANAAVAVEAAHEQNMHLAFVLSVLVGIMGAVCAWLVMANLATGFNLKTFAANRSGIADPDLLAG